MVHALTQVHRLLKPVGRMIDMHPLPERPHVEAYLEDEVVFSEPLLVSYLEEVAQAEDALTQAVDNGLFIAGRQVSIDFRHHATSPQVLFTHWDEIEPYSDSPQDPAVAASEKEIFSRLESFLQTSGSRTEIAIRERAAMSCFIPVKE